MESIGGYRVLRELGQGGMGAVYLCEDPRLDRQVAIKLLKAGEDADERALERFRREAKALARLGEHPHVVTIYDVGEARGLPFLVMRYVAGRSLQVAIHEEGPLADAEAARIARRVAQALHHTHEHGVVHRDVKPENVVLTAAGEPLLTDFGLCRFADSPSSLTAPDKALGTLGYLAPEQIADARSVDPRTDVFGLGGTLYAMLTRRVPFPGKTEGEILRRTMNGDVLAPRRLRPEVSADLERICLQALANRREDRYPSAAELGDDLERFLAGEPVHAQAPAAPSRASPDDETTPGDVFQALMDVPLPTSPGSSEDARVEALAAQGEEAFAEGRFAAAVAAFEAALQVDPDDFELLLRCAVARRRADDPHGAIVDYDRAFRVHPDSLRAHVGRGAARADIKDFIGAVQDFQRALALLPPGSTRIPRIQAALEKAQRRLGDSVVRRHRFELPPE